MGIFFPFDTQCMAAICWWTGPKFFLEKSFFFWKLGDFFFFCRRTMGWDQRGKDKKNSDVDFNFIVEVTTVQRLGRALCIFQTVHVVKSFIEP